MQQLRDALPLPCSYRYILFDRDAKFGNEVFEFLEASGVRPIRTTARSPWQNGIAERWVGSARRELLDHVIPLNEQHLRRLGREYLAYYHEEARTSDWRRRRRQEGPLKHAQDRRATFWPCLESAVFIIGIPGHKRLSKNTTDGQPGDLDRAPQRRFDHRQADDDFDNRPVAAEP